MHETILPSYAYLVLMVKLRIVVVCLDPRIFLSITKLRKLSFACLCEISSLYVVRLTPFVYIVEGPEYLFV